MASEACLCACPPSPHPPLSPEALASIQTQDGCCPRVPILPAPPFLHQIPWPGGALGGGDWCDHLPSNWRLSSVPYGMSWDHSSHTAGGEGDPERRQRHRFGCDGSDAPCLGHLRDAGSLPDSVDFTQGLASPRLAVLLRLDHLVLFCF